ncbi:MAG: 30S ribosomal protein S6 [Phycisphaerales bacterium]|nr:MAG: 30S ribosomal protein S6 [Phycisphaerales bacterium]
MNTYEMMLLLDPAFASNEEDVDNEINRLMERAGGQIIAKHRWDERRLAYEIKRRKRGVYFLIYMRAPGSSIRPLERDVQLSEGILRALIVRADHVSEEKMHNPIAPPSEFARRPGDEWGRGGRRGEGRRSRERPGEEARRKAEQKESEPAEVASEPQASAPADAESQTDAEEPGTSPAETEAGAQQTTS